MQSLRYLKADRSFSTFELKEKLRLHPAHGLVLPRPPLRQQRVDLVDEDDGRLDGASNTNVNDVENKNVFFLGNGESGVKDNEDSNRLTMTVTIR